MNEVRIDVNQQKEISLSILKNVQLFCEKNSIKFYVAYGTLLGAVRHQGFIPWDDDIDIIMLREDYNNFVNSYRDSRFECIAFENNRFYVPYAKVIDPQTKIVSETVISKEPLGIGIDIFPIDYLSDDKIEAQRIKNGFTIDYTFLRYSLFNNINELKDKSVLKEIVYYISRAFGFSYWVRRYKNRVIKYTTIEKKKYCALLPLINSGAKPIFNSEIFDKLSSYKFEDTLVPSVEDYDQFLSTVYGDYMTIPPVEKRITHENNAYYK